ncbi:purine-nucleoside phosphorylase [uncultured Megasphaera sp.]|uniref:purine-nucleoside phosphorylase n=1 Tax=uncultured Megasphaera sp. TaxID=165188 RepID=UPI00258764F9|nr:purine-nucleoside phosphorylase [uncultured Megasphaera sp.]
MSLHIAARDGEIADRILLPGDPLRAKYIAETFLDDAVCYTDIRNILGYTGTYKGVRLSVQGTGMGIPSISIYATELMRDYGVKKLIRVGTCGAMRKDIRLRDVIIAQGATTDSSIIRNIFGGSINYAPLADFTLLRQAYEQSVKQGIPARVGNIVSVDRFYDDEIDNDKLTQYGIMAVEMETAGLYTLAAKYGAQAQRPAVKMSKSLGNVVDPFVLGERYGQDAIRYHILREMALGADSLFSNEIMINRINSDLANGFGNLVSRTVAMADKYFGGTLPTERESDALDEEFKSVILGLCPTVDGFVDETKIKQALEAIFEGVSRANKYIDETTPWILAKDPAQAKRLEAVMYNLADAVRNIAILISSMMPFTAPKIFEQLGLTVPEQFDLNEVAWGNFPDGTKVAKGQPIFPRIEEEEEDKPAEAKKEAKPAKKEKKADKKNAGVVTPDQCTIEDFGKLDLRVGTILSAEKMPNADKLLKIQVQVGDETRTIVSGIAPYYKEEELTGKNVIVIANLKPAKLRGVESRGMLLAASDGQGNLKLAEVPGIASGSKVK